MLKTMKLNQTSLFFQMILGFTLITIVIIFTYSYFFYRHSSQIVYEKTTQYLLTSVIQMQGKIDQLLKEHEKFAATLVFSPQIHDNLTLIAEGNQANLTALEMERFVSFQSVSFSPQLFVRVYDVKDGTYSFQNNMNLLWNEQQMKQQAWYSYSKSLKGKLYWFTSNVYKFNKLTPAIIGERAIYNVDSLNYIGDIVLAFPYDELDKLIGDFDLGSAGNIQIIDYAGNIVYSKNKADIGKPADRELIKDSKISISQIKKRTINNVKQYEAFSVSGYNDWIAAAFVGETELNKDLKDLQLTQLFFMLLGIACAIFLIAFFSNSITKPLRFLARHLERLDQGLIIPYRKGITNREVTVLFESYNYMVRNLHHTIAELAEIQISEKQAQLVALKAQFRHHFLYNTLNAIYWSLVDEGHEKQAGMVITLSELLQYSIQWGSDKVAIREDLKHLERFIDLIKLRFGEKLSFELDVDPDLSDKPIMKLMLQPLIENAITHGVEGLIDRPWKIRVVIRKTKAGIEFIVEDNGIGMSAEEMSEYLLHTPRIKLNDSLSTGLGIYNVISRLKLNYGKNYSFQLKESNMGGLKVIIIIPLEENTNENTHS